MLSILNKIFRYEKTWKIFLGCVLAAVPVLLLLSIGYKLNEVGNNDLTCSLGFIWFGLILLLLSNTVFFNKRWCALLLLFLGISLIFINPFVTNNALTKRTLSSSNLGWFEVDIKYIDGDKSKEMNNICLLLRTPNNLYIKSGGSYIVYPAQNYAIRYQSTKKSCENNDE